MRVKVQAAVAAGFDGVNVAGLARELGVSRRWVYELRRRYEAEGLAGLEPRSRRPLRSPQQIPAAIEDEVVRWRKQLADAGLDAGAATIRWHLEHDATCPVPSTASIWRILHRRGLIEPQPRKRPRSSYRRFEHDLVNGMWQIDATSWVLADGTSVEIVNIIDDHSRVCVAAVATPTTTGAVVLEAFLAAGSRWGLPTQVLTDNAPYFTGKPLGYEARFEHHLRTLGIKPITSTPRHPTTCGKVERFHQTMKKRLAAVDPAHSLDELQHTIDTFVAYYNTQRPHRALGRHTPAHVHATDPATGPGGPLADPILVRRLTVTPDGIINTNPWRIGVGVPWAGHPVTVIIQGRDAAVFSADHLIRTLTIDPTRSYQATGNPRGGTKQPRHPKPLPLPMTRDTV